MSKKKPTTEDVSRETKIDIPPGMASAIIGVGQQEPAPPMRLVDWPLADVEDNPWNPRVVYTEDELNDLANSIVEHGIMQPPTAREKPGDPDKAQLIAGHRRTRGARLAGLKWIKVLIRPATDLQMAELAIIENEQRAAMNPVETARAYKRLADEFQQTHEQIAERVGRSRAVVSNAIRMLELPESVLRHLTAGRITEAHMRSFSSYAAFPEFIAAYVDLVVSLDRPSKDFEKGLWVNWQIEQELNKRKLWWECRGPDLEYFQPIMKRAPRRFVNYYCLDKKLWDETKAQAAEDRAKKLQQFQEQVAAGDAIGLAGKTYGVDYITIYDSDHPKACAACADCPCFAVATVHGSPKKVCLDPKRYKGFQQAEKRAVRDAALKKLRPELSAVEAFSERMAEAAPRLFARDYEDEARRAMAVIIHSSIKNANDKVLQEALKRRGLVGEEIGGSKLRRLGAADLLDILATLAPETQLSLALEVNLQSEMYQNMSDSWHKREKADWYLAQMKKLRK